MKKESVDNRGIKIDDQWDQISPKFSMNGLTTSIRQLGLVYCLVDQ
jgi:hypothetical protein